MFLTKRVLTRRMLTRKMTQIFVIVCFLYLLILLNPFGGDDYEAERVETVQPLLFVQDSNQSHDSRRLHIPRIIHQSWKDRHLPIVLHLLPLFLINLTND